MDSTTLRFTFANISTIDPDSECFVDLEDTGPGYRGKFRLHPKLAATADRMYLAKDCTPMIPGYPQLAQKLQKEGEDGLGSFLRDVRVGFERMLTT